jgi:hypothetical protein
MKLRRFIINENKSVAVCHNSNWIPLDAIQDFAKSIIT